MDIHTIEENTIRNPRRKTPDGTKYPVLCRFSITPGYSEYVIRNGFKVHIGKHRHASSKIYLPYSWIGKSILFAVQEDGYFITSDPTDCTITTPAGQHTNAALHSITPEMCRRDKRKGTRIPFCNAEQHIEYLTKTVRKEKIYSTNKDKPDRYTGAVFLPPEWIGKNIICIRSYDAGEIPRQAKEEVFHDMQLITIAGRLRLSKKNTYLLLNERRIEY